MKTYCKCQCPYHDKNMKCDNCGKNYIGWIAPKVNKLTNK